MMSTPNTQTIKYLILAVNGLFTTILLGDAQIAMPLVVWALACVLQEIMGVQGIIATMVLLSWFYLWVVLFAKNIDNRKLWIALTVSVLNGVVIYLGLDMLINQSNNAHRNVQFFVFGFLMLITSIILFVKVFGVRLLSVKADESR